MLIKKMLLYDSKIKIRKNKSLLLKKKVKSLPKGVRQKKKIKFLTENFPCMCTGTSMVPLVCRFGLC